MSKHYESYAVREKNLPYFQVKGGPFVELQTMGWHIVDANTGLTAGVSCDANLCKRLNALETIARMFDRRDLYHLISNKLHDSGFLEVPEDEWEQFKIAVRELKDGKS